MPFNKAQQIVLATYAQGEFAGITTMEEVKNAGDSLFRFLMSEMSDGEDCTDLETAHARINTAFREVQDVRDAIEQAYVEEDTPGELTPQEKAWCEGKTDEPLVYKASK